MREVILDKLRCPASGERLERRGDELVTASGKQRYELLGGRIALFAEHPDSPDATRQMAHYDRLAPLYLRNLDYPHTAAYQAHLDARVREALGPGRLGEVAELCCGQGEALGMFADRIDLGVGVDVSPAMLGAAAARLPDERFALLQADATRLPLADAGFDRVVMLGGVHHVADRLGLFREVARILRPGGRFLFREPLDDFAPWRWLRAAIYRLSPHLDHETERPLRREETGPELSKAGLALRSWRPCGFLGFCLLMNSDVLVINRGLRFAPGIGALSAAAARFDDWCVSHRPLRHAGLQVVGVAEKPAS